jgi:hypothetical protein
MDALGVIIYGETAHMALSLCSTRGQRGRPFYCYDAAAICDYTNLTTPALAYVWFDLEYQPEPALSAPLPWF